MKKLLYDGVSIILICIAMYLIAAASPISAPKREEAAVMAELEAQKENTIQGKRSGVSTVLTQLKPAYNKKMYEVAEKEGFVKAVIKRPDGSEIDLNTATEEELTELDGVGKKMARQIIEYREKTGYFTDVDDLRNVKGIGEKKLEKIKNTKFGRSKEKK